MKYLINDSFKAMRRGEFVKANEQAGEFILDESSDYSLSTLREIAKENKIELKSKITKASALSTILDKLGELKMSEQNEPTESEKVESIVKEGVEAGKSDDLILVDIVNSGVKFTKAMKLFKNAVEKLGLRISTKDRKEQIGKLLTKEDFNPESFQDVQDMANKIVKEIEDTNYKQSVSVIRSWAKANDVQLPKKPKGAPSGGVRGFRAKAFQFMLDNPGVDEDGLKKFVADEGKKDVVGNSMFAILKFARDYVEVVTGDEKAS